MHGRAPNKNGAESQKSGPRCGSTTSESHSEVARSRSEPLRCWRTGRSSKQTPKKMGERRSTDSVPTSFHGLIYGFNPPLTSTDRYPEQQTTKLSPKKGRHSNGLQTTVELLTDNNHISIQLRAKSTPSSDINNKRSHVAHLGGDGEREPRDTPQSGEHVELGVFNDA